MSRRVFSNRAPMRRDTRPILPQSAEDAALMAHARARMAEREQRKVAHDHR